ncbi:hypothetical protein HDU76_000450 [Blyttiomyces sp. JEL0837]|nr:hypothetical protein HDU76_000450 [Blyttiomyces sp. JEL0837]
MPDKGSQAMEVTEANESNEKTTRAMEVDQTYESDEAPEMATAALESASDYAEPSDQKQCRICSTTESPLWRRHPDPTKNDQLCNACCLREKRNLGKPKCEYLLDESLKPCGNTRTTTWHQAPGVYDRVCDKCHDRLKQTHREDLYYEGRTERSIKWCVEHFYTAAAPSVDYNPM